MYSDWWGRMAAMIMFIGFFLTFIPQFVLGYLGMPRRYHAYPPEFQVLNVMSSAGASILAVAYILPFAYLIHSLFYGKKAGPNPWGATGLEWQTSSPPPTHNFETMPVVVEGPYEYALPTAPKPSFIDGQRVGPDGLPVFESNGQPVSNKEQTHVVG
jgi:cytochrome c oxidase subunit 1